MGDSLLLGLEERLSLGKGLGERLLTNLWETERETQMLFQLSVSLCGYTAFACVHWVQAYLSCSMAFSVLR